MQIRFSHGTLRVREFLTRNGHPHAYIDLDRDSGVQELLDQFNISEEDVPVVICRGELVLRGAAPSTGWLEECLALDAKGFIKTGPDLSKEDLEAAEWPFAGAPYLLETSLPGVFAVGDVRGGNVKRVASAVGEGSIAVAFVHQVLHE